MNEETFQDEVWQDAVSQADGDDQRRSSSSGAPSTSRMVIAATFTADLLQSPLKFWMQELDIAVDLTLAPYGQIMQELLHPQSTLSRNATGINILLIRLEDWLRDRAERSVADNLEHIRAVSGEFLSALRTLRGRNSATTLVFLCPPSSSLPIGYYDAAIELQSELTAHLKSMPGVYCWTHKDLVRLYPVAEYADPESDRIGHIPYTSDYFVALATLFARRVAALRKPQYKVIAIDCDNTLWKGICGEDGPDGIELTPQHLQLQAMLVRQHDCGMLLCLCTKNNPEDVQAVFRGRPEMPLREEHLICSRSNWEAKSASLRSLSEELELSLDSFILIDDNPMECAEVMAHCPSVLTLQLPRNETEIPHFLDHVWAFDRVGVTEDAKRRTEQYKRNRARNEALQGAMDLEQFLASLALEVDVTPLQPQQLERVVELIQRTNQFNLTTIRRTASEIELLWSSRKMQIMVVHVRDRFGDYGLVGAVLFRSDQRSIDVDTFVLSCRVLARGVEHRIVNELGRIGREAALSQIVLRFRQSQRNAPAWKFLTDSFAQFRLPTKGDDLAPSAEIFAVPVEYAQFVSYEAAARPLAENELKLARVSAANTMGAPQWHETAYRLSRIGDIVRAVKASAPKRREGCARRAPPRTPTEAAVAEIWEAVLHVEQIGACDDFFELGGDSLLAVQAVSRIGSVLGLDLPLHEFFQEATVEKVASKLALTPTAGAAIARSTDAGPAPLSAAQRRLWFIDQLEGSNAAYHIPLALQLRGELDRHALQAALDRLLDRHTALRTVFDEISGEPVQQIKPDVTFALSLIDLSAVDSDLRDAEYLRRSHEELAAPFDLRSGPLIRGTLLRLSHDRHVLLIIMHHIVSDGWSTGILIRELSALYNAFRESKPDPLSPVPIQYADYARWDRQWLTANGAEERLRFWQRELQGIPELLELPTDRPRPAAQSYRGGSVCLVLEPQLTAELKAFSRARNLTLAMTLQAAWAIVLSRLSGQDSVVVGMPVANRRRTEVEGVIGFFVNTLALHMRLQADPTVHELLQRVKQTMVQAYAHQDVPFEQVVEALQPVRSLSHGAIFQVMFVLQNTPRSAPAFAGLSVTELEVPLQTAQFDLSLSLQESGGRLVGAINYASDLFDRETVEQWSVYFKSAISAMLRQPDLEVSRLQLMGAEERRRIVELFNVTDADYPREQLIHELFERRVEEASEAVAVVYNEERVTYAELNKRANQLARYLQRNGMRPGEYIPVLMTRSRQSVVAQLAVLKAGGAYVPVDTGMPRERQAFLLRDCGARLVLADVAKPAALEGDHTLWLEWSEMTSAVDAESTTNLGLSMTSAAPAYVMYTSGSTGAPKGVVVPHYAVNRLAINNGYARIDRHDCLAHHSNPTFDASTFEIWVALLNGARVVVVPQDIVLEARHFAALLEEQRVTALYLSVGLFNQYADALAAVFRRLRYLLVGGDALEPGAIRRVLRSSPPQHLLNAYGPTECTTFATTHPITAVAENAKSIPIGRPMSNARIYILDRWGQPMPVGLAGEIHIAGDGVALGYLNRPELTAERFVPDPFATNRDARMYKTGDLARWRTDGSIEYLGRNDDQVKIRGFRVELGEIETQLNRHSQVSESVVLAREDVPGTKCLVAYVVPSDRADAKALPSAETLRAHLKLALPEYMVPSAFVIVERMPLTANGKVDRRALPRPQPHAYTSQKYAAPQGETERTLALIWQELLQVERVGRNDSFFELGGHSLLGMQLVSRMQSSSGIDMPVRLLFEFPTLHELAAQVEDLRRTHLLKAIAIGGKEVEELLEAVATMPQSKVRQLLDELTMGGRQ
jgi:amino acid adenylation domain-containing protein/FkbH-like protein